MQHDLFFRGRCSRCRRMMTSRAVSFFTERMICLICVALENDLKAQLRRSGIGPFQFENSGHWPSTAENREAGFGPGTS